MDDLAARPPWYAASSSPTSIPSTSRRRGSANSIGHYENGDTLVVDTIGLSTDNSYIDNFRTPHTDKLHVVERFTIEPGSKFLSAIATVEDPDTFNEPLTMKQRWAKTNGAMQETVCAENNQDYFHQNLFPVPTADKPDF